MAAGTFNATSLLRRLREKLRELGDRPRRRRATRRRRAICLGVSHMIGMRQLSDKQADLAARAMTPEEEESVTREVWEIAAEIRRVRTRKMTLSSSIQDHGLAGSDG